jgi:hypothetical protein
MVLFFSFPFFPILSTNLSVIIKDNNDSYECCYVYSNINNKLFKKFARTIVTIRKDSSNTQNMQGGNCGASKEEGSAFQRLYSLSQNRNRSRLLKSQLF